MLFFHVNNAAVAVDVSTFGISFREQKIYQWCGDTTGEHLRI